MDFCLDGNILQNIAHDSRPIFGLPLNGKIWRAPLGNDCTKISYVGLSGVISPIFVRSF